MTDSDFRPTREYTAAEGLALIAGATFRPFTKTDWYAWAGCETASPLIADVVDPDGRECSLVLDGDKANLVPYDAIDGGALFVLASLATS